MDILNDFIDFFKEVVCPGFNSSRIELDKKNRTATFYLEPELPPRCPHCNSGNVVVHEYRTRVVKAGKHFASILFM